MATIRSSAASPDDSKGVSAEAGVVGEVGAGGGAVEVEGTGEAIEESSSADSGCFDNSDALTFEANSNTLS